VAIGTQQTKLIACAILTLFDPAISKNHSNSARLISSIKTVCEGLALYQDLGPEDLVVCDLDETVVTHAPLPEASLKKPFHQQIAERQFHLIDDRLPEAFNLLHQKKVPVVALTHTRTGQFESIPSMERWRFNIVNKLGLRFSFDEKKHTFHLTKVPKPYPSFFKGIILTGHHPKGRVLQAFLKKTKQNPKRILFFDDLKSNIDNVHKTLTGIAHLHCFHIIK
jgi:predicted phosphatase